MLINYIKITLRYLAKNRIFTGISIFGLTTGFFCFLLIALYIHDELTFDQFHKDSPVMYRVVQNERQEDGQVRNISTIAARIGPESAKQISEVTDAMRISAFGRLTVGNDPANRDYERITITDPHFFKFFDFALVAGDPATALTKPDAVVLSESLAKKYFGNEPALGKRLWTNFDESEEMEVTGVMKDFPKNSHIQLDLIFSEATLAKYFRRYNEFNTTDWTSNSILTYVKVSPGTDVGAFGKKLTELVKKNYPSGTEFRSDFTLQALGDIHLYSENIQGNAPSRNSVKPLYLYMFSAVGFLLLLIASLNYMNLSTAVAFTRTREIGTRKTLGAGRGQLILQFLGEAIALSTASILLATALLQLLLPSINAFLEKNIALSTLPPGWIVLLVVTMLLSGALSAVYPAFIVSRVSPAEAIKKEIRIAHRSVPVRKLLVAAQFTISIVMLSSTLIIYQQLEYIREKDLGFTLDNLLVVDINSGSLRRNFEAVKAEFGNLAEVGDVTVSSRVPGEWKSFPIASVGQADIKRDMIFVGIDQDFMKTYDINLLEGRNFGSSPADSTKVILTKLAVEQLGLKNPIGQVIEIPSVRWGGSIETLDQPFRAEVIGVADDFYFESFRQKMMPLIFSYHHNPIQAIDYYTLRVRTSNWDETIKRLKAINTKFDTENPLEYTFLDGQFEEFYRADTKRGQTFLVFSSLIVLIACLGLFALVSFAVENRKKEIGIRKVLGASVTGIVGLLSIEFLALVVAGSLLAVPIAYVLMRNWLMDFAYHVNMGVTTFLISGIITLLIAWVTIGLRSIKAARANPVDSLRAE